MTIYFSWKQCKILQSSKYIQKNLQHKVYHDIKALEMKYNNGNLNSKVVLSAIKHSRQNRYKQKSKHQLPICWDFLLNKGLYEKCDVPIQSWTANSINKSIHRRKIGPKVWLQLVLMRFQVPFFNYGNILAIKGFGTSRLYRLN